MDGQLKEHLIKSHGQYLTDRQVSALKDWSEEACFRMLERIAILIDGDRMEPTDEIRKIAYDQASAYDTEEKIYESLNRIQTRQKHNWKPPKSTKP